MKKDPYRPLHKAIRNRLFDVGMLAGTTDFSETETAQQFKTRFDGLVMFLEHHGHHEDQVIHPLLTKRKLAGIHSVEKQHAALDQALAQLKTQLDALLSQKVQTSWEEAHAFYLSFQHYISQYLAHIHDEETLILPLMQQHCADAEFDELAKADFGGEDPEQLRPMLGRMMPAFNAYDIALILSDIQRVVPPETFTKFCDVFQGEMAAEDWAKTKMLLQL